MSATLIVVHLIAAVLFVALGCHIRWLSERNLDGWLATRRVVTLATDALNRNNEQQARLLDFCKELTR